jgi:hypothetical protein
MSIDRNSLVSHLASYVHALSKDVAWAYLSNSDWERDFSRLSHELARKGSRILTLDMPALGKHFDKCLDQSMYKPSKLYLGRVPKKGPQVPVFLRDLYLQVFDHEGKLRDTPKPEVIFLLRTLFMSAKKLRLPFSNRSLQSEVHNFLRIEHEIARPTLAWDSDDLFPSTLASHSDMQSGWLGSAEGRVSRRDETYGGGWTRADRKVGLRDILDPGKFVEADGHNPHRVTEVGLDMIQRVADIIVAQFGDFSLEEPSELPKHGPGAVAEGGKHINKYAFFNWPRKLQATFPADFYASPRLGETLESEGESEMGHSEVPSRLIAVPKTQKGPRLIAAEPLAHQWIQQLIKNQLEGRLPRTALKNTISFRDQTLSGDMALRGSVDGSLTTIDLSSASDRLSCWLVERMLRVNLPLLIRLHACRTRWLTYRNELGQSEYIRLNKFAPMGSAVTFPVQSIIYAIVAIGAVLIQDETKVTSRSVKVAARQVRVFGDDIIVPRRAHKYTVRYLQALGLRVNPDKTYEEGNFRESCGVDAWQGDDVTPPYLLAAEAVSSVLELGSAVAVRNNFYRKGYWNVAYWLDRQFSRWERFLPDIPAHVHTAGRASFLGANDSECHIRYNEKLQREEVRVLLPYRKVDRGAMAVVHRLFQWFIERPLPEIRWTSGWTKHEVLKTRPGWIPRDFIAELGNTQSVL